MPLTKIEKHNGNAWALWKIEEREDEFKSIITSDTPSDITHSKKKLEWYAGRTLVKYLMESLGLTYHGIVKDQFGKPFPVDSSYQLSLSHSYPYVAAYLHPSQSIGIDLEQPKPKLLHIAPRIFTPKELADAVDDQTKLCLFWCAKEVLVKVHGKKDLTFAKNLQIEPFSMQNMGEIVGRIIVNDAEEVVPLYYEVHKEFTVVLNKPKK